MFRMHAGPGGPSTRPGDRITGRRTGLPADARARRQRDAAGADRAGLDAHEAPPRVGGQVGQRRGLGRRGVPDHRRTRARALDPQRTAGGLIAQRDGAGAFVDPVDFARDAQQRGGVLPGDAPGDLVDEIARPASPSIAMSAMSDTAKYVCSATSNDKSSGPTFVTSNASDRFAPIVTVRRASNRCGNSFAVASSSDSASSTATSPLTSRAPEKRQARVRAKPCAGNPGCVGVRPEPGEAERDSAAQRRARCPPRPLADPQPVAPAARDEAQHLRALKRDHRRRRGRLDLDDVEALTDTQVPARKHGRDFTASWPVDRQRNAAVGAPGGGGHVGGLG